MTQTKHTIVSAMLRPADIKRLQAVMARHGFGSRSEAVRAAIMALARLRPRPPRKKPRNCAVQKAAIADSAGVAGDDSPPEPKSEP